jgi:phosphoribosyl 1,2-cyclic phosphodiesterase
MRIMTIASGSSGNCIYIGSENTHILIDAGISRKKIDEGLRAADLSLKDITAILVTHEHSDHIKGLGVTSRKDEIPVYSTQGTIDGILSTSTLGELPKELFHPILPDGDIQINDLTIHPFSVSHDANDPVAYTVSFEQKKAGVVTDLGFYNDYIVDNMKGCDSLIVEANHDINLLQVGSYPYYLKQRILGKKGHLSNEASGQLINSLLNDHITNIMLGHLSKENNYDKLAYETVRLEIDMSGNSYKANDFDIEVAKRSEPSKIITI